MTFEQRPDRSKKVSTDILECFRSWNSKAKALNEVAMCLLCLRLGQRGERKKNGRKWSQIMRVEGQNIQKFVGHKKTWRFQSECGKNTTEFWAEEWNDLVYIWKALIWKKGKIDCTDACAEAENPFRRLLYSRWEIMIVCTTEVGEM